MNNKSHVSLEHKICVVCGAKYKTDTVLIHKRLSKSLPPNAVTGWGMCNEHQKLKDDGFIAMVGCDESKSTHTKNGNINPEGAFRTGKIAHVKKDAWNQITKIPVPEGMMFFCGDDVIEQLNDMTKDAS